MRIIAAVGKDFAVNALSDALRKTFGESVFEVFYDIVKAVEYSETVKIDLVFLDMNLCRGETERTAELFRKNNPDTGVVFVTGMNKNGADSSELSSNEWLLQPVSSGTVNKEPEEREILLYVQCFGNFDVFKTDRTRLDFKRKKSKELFAYLIYRRGAACSNSEIVSAIFDDDNYDRSRQQYLQKIIQSMMDALSAAGADKAVIRGRGNISVDVNRIQCDYYRFTESDTDVLKSWSGEFMTQYSWAEPVAGYIADKI